MRSYESSRKRERSQNTVISKDRTAGGFQNEAWGQDFGTGKNLQKACKQQEGSVHQARKLQIRQMKLMKALTPLACIHEKETETFDPQLLHTNTTSSDLQIEPPSVVAEYVDTNWRYKDVSDIFSLSENHDSDSDINDAEGYLSDGSKLSSILKYTHILGNA
jgi:hypothetical protein